MTIALAAGWAKRPTLKKPKTVLDKGFSMPSQTRHLSQKLPYPQPQCKRLQ